MSTPPENPGRAAVSRAALELWRDQGKWADVALEGVSMDPIIRSGATLRVRFARMTAGDLRPGDVVIYAAPAGLIAHRVVRAPRRGRRRGTLLVKGDPLSSRRAAWIRPGDVLGRVTTVTQPDGSRRYLNTPSGRLLGRVAALLSMSLGALDARWYRLDPGDPARSLTGRSLRAVTSLHDAIERRKERRRGLPLAAEERLLALAARPDPDDRSRAAVAQTARQVADWGQVREQAVALGLAPLVFRSLSHPEPGRLCPAGFLHQLSRAAHAASFRSLQQRRELARLLESLGERGIEPILLKGAALACTVYDEPGLRTMKDFDLLVREEEMPAAVETLERLDYVPLYRAALSDRRRRAAYYAAHHHSTPMIARSGRAVVELHRHIIHMKEPGRYDIGRIRVRAEPARLDGRAVLVPSSADLLLHTCLHMSYSDRFVGKLRDLLDLHLIVARGGSAIDWSALLHEIPSEAAARCLVSCLDLSRRLHGTPVPADFLHEVSRASKLGFLGSRMLRALAVSVLFGPSPSGRSILSPATAKWCCDTLLRANGWPGRFRALMSLLAGA
ncbi:MAG TPA: nucleotidyltransferase family protein [Candidatus Polarisedimenticolia bacterium]|nr:nucleotidyltransferase family protein [Candidatus Polarisedimenticolia bacterium]